MIPSFSQNFFHSLEGGLEKIGFHIECDADSSNVELIKNDGSQLTNTEIKNLSKLIFEKTKGTIHSDENFENFIKKMEGEGHLGKTFSVVINKTQKMYHKNFNSRPYTLGSDIKGATRRSFALGGSSSFASAKTLSADNLQPPLSVKDSSPFPTSSLTRLLTGDVKPEWILGLGKTKRLGKEKHTGPLRAAEGYKDVFVSTLDECAKKGGKFSITDKDHVTVTNDLDALVKSLDLNPEDVIKTKTHGAWMILIHPGVHLAIPSQRKNEWNPLYEEGGYTQSGQQEWVTTNVDIQKEMRAGTVRIYKIDPKGDTTEWKVFKDKLYSLPEWEKVINEYAKGVSKKTDKS